MLLSRFYKREGNVGQNLNLASSRFWQWMDLLASMPGFILLIFLRSQVIGMKYLWLLRCSMFCIFDVYYCVSLLSANYYVVDIIAFYRAVQNYFKLINRSYKSLIQQSFVPFFYIFAICWILYTRRQTAHATNCCVLCAAKHNSKHGLV